MNQPAFTLIELLIIVSVVALFSSFSLAYYNRLSAENLLLEETQKAANVLELAKKKASAAEGAQLCTTSFDGYRVMMNNSLNYRLERCCNGSCTAIIARYSIRPGVVLSSPTPASILFRPLAQQITAANITFRNAEIARCMSVTISATGTIAVGNKVAC